MTLSRHSLDSCTRGAIMAAQSTGELRSEKLDFRVSPTAKAKLQAAAAITNSSVSDFVLASALSRAEDALADRTVFRLDAKTWEAFQKALDAPPHPMPRMKALLSRPSPFEPGGK